MCEKDPGCFNSKTLVLDTNFFDQINRTVNGEIHPYTLGKSADEQGRIFLKEVHKVLGNIAQCGGGRVYTSAKVYHDEIDITKLDSALRTADEAFDRFCMEEEFITTLSNSYQERIHIEDVIEEEVQELDASLSENVGSADASLLLLSLKLSQDVDVILITDDLALQKVIRDISRRGEVVVGGSHFSTASLHYMSSLSFFREIHSCCEMANNRWMVVVTSFFRHQQERYEQGKIAEETYSQHLSCAGPYMAQLSADCDAKRKYEEKKQLYQMFGIDNERQN